MRQSVGLFTYIESLPVGKINNLYDILRIDNTTPIEVILFRLLSGTCNIEYKNNTIKQRKNYLKLGFPNINRVSFSYIKNLLTCDAAKARQYFNNNRTNTNFFKNVLFEFSSYFYYNDKEEWLRCFVHLYRIIEHISYAFPLIYASKSKNYKGSFSSLKDFLTGENELAFFYNFQKTLFENNGVLETSIRIFFVGSNSELNNIQRIFEHLEENKIIKLANNVPGEIELLYKDFFKFILALRNRYFHFLNGSQMNNIENIDVDIGIVFQAVNEHILNWVSHIYYEILLFGLTA